jgi:hypothetical protein
LTIFILYKIRMERSFTSYSGYLKTGHVLLGLPGPPTGRHWNCTMNRPVRVPYPFRMSGDMVRKVGSVIVSKGGTGKKGSAM